MPKVKTKKAVAKRFKVSKKGKVKMAKANRRHILTNKTRKSKRQSRRPQILGKADEARIRQLLEQYS